MTFSSLHINMHLHENFFAIDQKFQLSLNYSVLTYFKELWTSFLICPERLLLLCYLPVLGQGHCWSDWHFGRGLFFTADNRSCTCRWRRRRDGPGNSLFSLLLFDVITKRKTLTSFPYINVFLFIMIDWVSIHIFFHVSCFTDIR